jgi:hypothetical protein
MVTEADWERLYERVHDGIVVPTDLRGDEAKAVVHAAIGMTMEYADCSGLRAVEVLNARAREIGQPLVEVAVGVLQRRFRPGRDS